MAVLWNKTIHIPFEVTTIIKIKCFLEKNFTSQYVSVEIKIHTKRGWDHICTNQFSCKDCLCRAVEDLCNKIEAVQSKCYKFIQYNKTCREQYLYLYVNVQL